MKYHFERIIRTLLMCFCRIWLSQLTACSSLIEIAQIGFFSDILTTHNGQMDRSVGKIRCLKQVRDFPHSFYVYVQKILRADTQPHIYHLLSAFHN